ncbi:hypothetical protein ACF0H5_002879 [Mactra antiquata]
MGRILIKKIFLIMINVWFLAHTNQVNGRIQRHQKPNVIKNDIQNSIEDNNGLEILNSNKLNNEKEVHKNIVKRRVHELADLLSETNTLTECAVLDNKCKCYMDPMNNKPSINCRYEELYDIPAFQAIDVVYYQIMFSEGNYITVIPDRAFENLKVQRINLLKNKLTDVKLGAFYGLEEYLEELLIEGSGNKGEDVPFRSMMRLNKLRSLTLKNFRLDQINKINYFSYFSNLELLSLQELSLQLIEAEAFKDKLPKLHTLSFDDVNLRNIPVESLSDLVALRYLNLRNTHLTTIYNSSFEKMLNLKSLNLAHNSIQNMEENAFKGISNQLKDLDLSSNKLQVNSLQALSTKEWRVLENLYISYNQDLTTLPDNVFQFMPNLQYLYMSNINLKHITRHMFHGLDNLFALDLSWNHIETIQDYAFYKLNNMNQLILQFQTNSGERMLQLMPTQFEGLQQSLVRLDLEGTKLRSLSFWPALATLSELKELNIRNTGLKDIPKFAFSRNTKLTKLSLENNEITYLQQGAFIGLEQSLKDISLNFNNLTTISHCVFNNFTRLETIHLLENPLYCDCRIKWLHTLIHKYSNNPLFVKDEFRCSKPDKYAGHLLYDIPATQLQCTTTETCYIITPPKTTVPATTRLITTTKPSTTKPDIKLNLDIVSTFTHSISLAWRVTHSTFITGFELQVGRTSVSQSRPINIHRNEFTRTVYNLSPGTFYHICITAEVQGQIDNNIKDCTTTQTMGINTDVDTQEGIDNDSAGDDRNVTIGIIIATTATVILIISGICAFVKYKFQKIKEVGKVAERMCSPYNDYYDRQNRGKVITQNEYSDIDEAKIASQYQVLSTRNVQRQFGIDNRALDLNPDMNPYHYGTYMKIMGQRKLRRKNPYENDDEMDIKEEQQVKIDKDNVVHYRNDLEERHSAPSRLDAANLKRQYERKNSRPLPATPVENTKQKRCSTLKPVKTKDRNKTGKETVVTMATVHDDLT